MAHTAASVVLSESSLSDVTFGQSGDFVIVADTLGDPGLNWRYGYVSSPWVDSELLTSAVKAKATLAFEVDVSGSDIAALVSNIATVRTMLSQFAYTATVTVGGEAVAYSCDPGRLSKKGGV